MRLHEAAHATGENGVRRPFLTHPAPCTTAHAYAYNDSVSMEGVDRIAQIAWARYEGTVRAPVADPVARCIAALFGHRHNLRDEREPTLPIFMKPDILDTEQYQVRSTSTGTGTWCTLDCGTPARHHHARSCRGIGRAALAASVWLRRQRCVEMRPWRKRQLPH